MLLEDFQKPNEALEYIHTLPLNQVQSVPLFFDIFFYPFSVFKLNLVFSFFFLIVRFFFLIFF